MGSNKEKAASPILLVLYNVYEWEWKDGKEHGQGCYTYPDGAVYKGMSKDGEQHGQGHLTYPSGAIYEGDFKDGKRHGQGRYTGVPILLVIYCI